MYMYYYSSLQPPCVTRLLQDVSCLLWWRVLFSLHWVATSWFGNCITLFQCQLQSNRLLRFWSISDWKQSMLQFGLLRWQLRHGDKLCRGSDGFLGPITSVFCLQLSAPFLFNVSFLTLMTKNTNKGIFVVGLRHSQPNGSPRTLCSYYFPSSYLTLAPTPLENSHSIWPSTITSNLVKRLFPAPTYIILCADENSA